MPASTEAEITEWIASQKQAMTPPIWPLRAFGIMR